MTELQPEAPRGWYHLGLAAHRTGDLETARTAYARAADLGYHRKGFAHVRGLAEVERDPRVPMEELEWLPAEERAALVPVAALLRGEPEGAAAGPADPKARVPEDERRLWDGLARLARGETAEARSALALPKGRHLPRAAEEVRAFYHALAAARAGEPETALAEWTEVARTASRSASPLLLRLREGIDRLSRQRLAALLETGNAAEVLKAVAAARAAAPDEPGVLTGALIAMNRLAMAAAEAEDWRTAGLYWDRMRLELEEHPDLGPRAPVLRNLAIAREKLEQWEEAARAWGGYLGALPRRVSKKNPLPGVPLDERRAWLRRRILDQFRLAGRPDEAISYFRQAVKAEPDNLELRLEMATALLANEQFVAAQNEVGRILERDANFIPALLLQAHLYHQDGYDYAARQALRHVLQIDPAHEGARRVLAGWLAEDGMEAFSSRRYKQAREAYTQSLELVPDDPTARVFLAETELVLKKPAEARKHLEAALATGTEEAYVQAFEMWLRQKNEAEARGVLTRAAEAQIATPNFYIDLGATALLNALPAPPSLDVFGISPRPAPVSATPATPQEKWARELIEEGISRAEDTAEALHFAVAAIGRQRPGLAVEYARRLVELRADDANAHMTLALMQAMGGDRPGAQETLRAAERVARKQHNSQLVEQVRQIRQEINSPFFGMMGSLLAALGPEGLDELADEDFF